MDARAAKFTGATNPTVLMAREGETVSVEG
jgi:hypothetical protein